MAAQKVSNIYDGKLVLAQRIHDVKMRRVEAAQERTARGSAVLQLERIYQAMQDLLHAKLAAANAQSECNNDEANWLAQQCRVLRLKSAKMM